MEDTTTTMQNDHTSQLVVSLAESSLENISSDCGVPPPVLLADVTTTSASEEEDDDVSAQRRATDDRPPPPLTCCSLEEEVNISVQTVKRINFLVAGPSGSGKSTFCKRLLCRYFKDFEYQHKAPNNDNSNDTEDDEDTEEGPTLSIAERGRAVKVQGNTKIIITIVDTPGFGDSLNYNDRFEPVEKYILDQNLKYEKEEGFRKKYMEENDTRVHCCFYFLAPHRTTPLDCEFLRRLKTKVAITPIIAKADTMTISELETQLLHIDSFLRENKIDIFDYDERNIDTSWMMKPAEEGPTTTIHGKAFQHLGKKLSASAMEQAREDGNSSVASSSSSFSSSLLTAPRRTLPQIRNVFAVISGERHYIWGKASEEDPSHSDTQRLHKLLFRHGSLGKLQQRSDAIHDAWRLDMLQKQQDEEKRRAAVAKKKADATFFVMALFSFICLLLLIFTVFQGRRQHTEL